MKVDHSSPRSDVCIVISQPRAARRVRVGVAMMWAPANLARLVAWFLALMDSTCRAFVWRLARRLPGDSRAPDALPEWWLGDDETPPVAIVTGAGSGIGRATAKRLHTLGARVAVVCATLEEAEETSARIAEEAEAAEAGAGPSSANLTRAVKRMTNRKKLPPPVAFGADLRDGAAVDALVRALDADYRTTPVGAVRCVVHCAGVMRCSFARAKRSGLEETAAVNAVAPARLTRSLLAARADASPRGGTPRLRVVTVGSFTHRAVSAREMRRWVEWVDETRKQSPRSRRDAYVPATAYACSKTAATMFAYALEDATARVSGERNANRRGRRRRRDGARPPPPPSSALADPGLVDTAINREWPPALRLLYVLVARGLGVLAAPEDAAKTVCRACFLPDDPRASGSARRPRASRGEVKKNKSETPPFAYLFGAAGARLAPSRVVADAETREFCVRALERWAKL